MVIVHAVLKLGAALGEVVQLDMTADILNILVF